MIEIILETDSATSFEQKYLFTEAKEKPRTNLRRISVTTQNGKSGVTVNGKEIPTDDISIDDDDSDDSVDMDTLDSIDVDDDDAGDESSDDDVVTEPDDDSSEDDVDMDGEDDVVTDDSDDSGDDVVTDPGDEDDGSGDDMSGDDEVMTDDSDDDVVTEPDDDSDSGTDNSGEDAGGGDDQNMGDESGDGSNMSPEQKEEAIHKQALYRQFNLLYTTIGKYIQKLEKQTGLDDTLNHSINKVTDQLTSLQEFLYDYMIIKFKNEEYVKSVLFYERSVAVVSLCMDILDDIKKSRNRLLVKKKSNRKQ